MAWGTITIGALTLKETDILEDVTNANSGERSVKLEGAETVPGITLAQVEAKQEDIMGLIDRIIPVTFSRKSTYDGYYFVNDTNTQYEKWVEGPAQVRWSLSLILVGGQDAVDIEAQLANVVRANDFAQAGERWHAPNIGHYGYQVGTSVPAIVARTSTDGVINVYRSVPAATTPRWGSPVASFALGRARILQNAIERTGVGTSLTPALWELNNGLVRVLPGTGTTTLFVSCWDSGAWASKSWDLRIGGTTILPADMRSVTVLRNDFEMVSIRIIVQMPTDSSRHIVDLSLRRGSRFVEGYIQRPASGTLTVTADTVEAGTSVTGLIRATANDAAGNRYVVGSARSFTGDTTNGGFTKSATTTLDFYIGVELNGSSAVSGDAAADLQAQYIAAMAEKVGVVRR
jgi:hypothetical protein